MTNSKTTPTDKTEPVLLPCPFCGASLRIRKGVNAYGHCDTTGCYANRAHIVPLDDSRQVAAWNMRTTPQPSLSVGLDREVRERLMADVERDGYARSWAPFRDDLCSLLALAAPAEGYVMVPVEPTEAMIEAFYEATEITPVGAIREFPAGWSAMIAACLPAAPTGETGA